MRTIKEIGQTPQSCRPLHSTCKKSDHVAAYRLSLAVTLVRLALTSRDCAATRQLASSPLSARRLASVAIKRTAELIYVEFCRSALSCALGRKWAIFAQSGPLECDERRRRGFKADGRSL